MEIIAFSQLDNEIKEIVTKQIRDIFFSCTSIKTFRDQEHKDSFFSKWCGDYLANGPESFYVAIEGGAVIGYLSGYADSSEALNSFVIPGPEVFKDCFDKFPAHFHINCAPNHQGKGIGRKLVEHYVQQLNTTQVSGVHLITSTDADNLGFYRALGFNKEVLRPYKSHELLLMGKEIVA
jgi:ribosomal protein S18 acetylase RimI-like enzyme